MTTFCFVVSGWWLDPLVSLVRLLCDLWEGDAGSNSCLHQPPTTKQWVLLQWARERHPALLYTSLSRFVCSAIIFISLLSKQQTQMIYFYYVVYV